LNNNIKSAGLTRKLKTLQEAESARLFDWSLNNLNIHIGNSVSACSNSIQLLLSHWARELLKGLDFMKKRSLIFSMQKCCEALFEIQITSSFSYFKQKYPHKEKTYCLDIIKSNLLVRSENNTEFFSLKILQTTTI